ncbi:hypothetical protein FLA_1831 [Filimonas lacunae]|nr:hypothetical protein FLA_1831 [Filimonas lacunae]
MAYQHHLWLQVLATFYVLNGTFRQFIPASRSYNKKARMQ